MDECLLPSEIARLVFGYLKDEGCTDAAQMFLETSENLKECRSRNSQGDRFRTRVLGFNLVEMLQLVSRVYSLVEERTRRTPVPKHIAHGSFLEQLNYLLNASDHSNDLPNGVSENNTGLLKALNRTMFENTTFHKKLAENINKMRTTPEGLAPETIAESIVKEKGFEELIEELLDVVPIPETNHTGGKSSKENRPVKSATNINHSTKENAKKKTPDNSSESGKFISNCSQISIEDENAAAVQSILESSRMPSWKGSSDESDSVSKCTATMNQGSTDTLKQTSSILDKAMVDCVTPLKEIAYNTYNNSLNLELTADQEDMDDTGSVGGESENGDVCNKSTKTFGMDHGRGDATSGLASSPSPQLLTCTPVLLVCDTPNSQNQKITLGVTSCNLHTRAEDRRIKSKFRRILPKPTNTITQELNGNISYPNGITFRVLNQNKEADKKDSEEIDRIAENQAKVDNTQAENRIDEDVIGDVNENLVIEKTGLPDIQDSRQSLACSDDVREKERVKTDLCSTESVVNSQDQSTNIDKSIVEDKITPVDRQGPRRKLSLSTPRRGRHIRSLDFNTPNKKILGQRSKTSPKQILHQQKFRHSKLRSNLFKSPPHKLQTIQDTVEKDDEQIEKSIEHKIESFNQEVSSNVVVEKNVSEVLKLDDIVDAKVQNLSPGKNEKVKLTESTWDSNLRALVGETTNNCTVRRPRKRQSKKVIELKKRSAVKKNEEVNELNPSYELNDKNLFSVQNTNEPEATASVGGTKEEVSNAAQTTSGVELKTSPQHIFQTPLKVDQPFVPQTPILDTPLLKSIIDDTRTIDPDLLLTPSFRTTPFKTPRSEKKVMVQTLSPSKMLINNKSSEKIKIESVKKSPTLRSSVTNDKSIGTNNSVNNVSPESNMPSTRQWNQSSKTGPRNNGAAGKSDLIQSLMKQAEKKILGNISDMESEDDEETGTKTKSGIRCSKKANKKHKLNLSESRDTSEVSNKSHEDEASVSIEKDSETKPENTFPGKKTSPSKKDKIQDSTSVDEEKISQITDSVFSNTQNQSAKENDETLSKISSSPSVSSNLYNESQEKMDSPKIVNDNNSSSNSIPPKKKYVQTILLSTSTSMKSNKSLKMKSSSANSSKVVESSSTNIVVESFTANSKFSIVSPSKTSGKAVCDKSKDDSPKKRTSSTDQQTIDFLLKKKKRLLNKLREPNRLGRSSNRLGENFSEIATKKNSSITPTKNPSTVEGVCEVVSDQNQRVPVPRSPTPLDKSEAGKRILVGNELYEHILHDETRPVKVSTQQTVVDDIDLSISIFDVDMDGNEFETVFVAQPLVTLFEFIPPGSGCRNRKPDEVYLNRRVVGDEGANKDHRPTDNSVEKVSKTPLVNGTYPPPVDRTSRLVQIASNKTPISNEDDKTGRDEEERCYNLSRNLENSKTKHTTEKSRDRYSSSSSPRKDSHEKYSSEVKRSDKRSDRNRNRSRDRSREMHRSKSRHRDKSRGKHREESEWERSDHRRHSRIDSFSRSKDRSRSSDRTRRKETRRDSIKRRDKSSHSSSSRTKHHDKQKQDELPKKISKKVSALREEDSEDGEVHSKDDGSSDECGSATNAISHQNQSSSRSLSDASAARIHSKTQLGKRPSNDASRNIAEKRPKSDDAQKLLKNMDSDHLEKFLSVVHPDD